MRTIAIDFERPSWLCPGFLALLAGAVSMLGGCATTSGGTAITGADILRADRQHEAEIRAEANAPGPSPQDERRIAGAMAAHAAQEQQELAGYAKFQFQQKIELAEASAPKILSSTGGNLSGQLMGGTTSERREASIALGGRALPQGRGQSTSDASGSSDRRFYARSIMEDSVDQSVSDSEERNRQSDADTNAARGGGAPYGDPVPGRAGYVTSPVRSSPGYINVQGYAPGTQVMDPYTGRVIRVR